MNGKIFIIEDEPSIIQLVQYNLEKEGLIVSSATNGNEGLKELGGQEYLIKITKLRKLMLANHKIHMATAKN